MCAYPRRVDEVGRWFSGQVGGLRYCTDCTLCSHGMLYRGGNGDLGVVGGGRWRVYVRPCCVPSAVCVCVCDLCVREVSPLAVCLGRPTSLPPACALSWLLEFQRVHRHRHPCLLDSWALPVSGALRNCNDDVTQQICRDLRSALCLERFPGICGLPQRQARADLCSGEPEFDLKRRGGLIQEEDLRPGRRHAPQGRGTHKAIRRHTKSFHVSIGDANVLGSRRELTSSLLSLCAV